MTDVEGLIDAIISKNPKVSKEELLRNLEEKRKKSGGLISDEVLLRMVAAELGVEVPSAALVPVPPPVIGNLVPGLNDVTVVGRVIAVFPVKTSGTHGRAKFASLLIADKSGVMRVVLWNDKASLVEYDKIRVGQIVKFSHGYTKESRLGRVELHVSEKGEVEIQTENAKSQNYPTIPELSTKIREITTALKNRRINVIGKVKEVFQEFTFERKDSTEGKVMRFILADETGEIPVVVWNEKVNEAKGIIQKGAELQIVNAKVKKALNGRLEIHAEHETYIDVFKPEKESLKIADLKEGMKIVHVEGEVVTKPMLRDVKTSKGETVKLTVFEIMDETGRIWVSAWRKNAEKAANLKVGDKIAVKGAYVKRGFGNQLEISTRNTTAIEIL